MDLVLDLSNTDTATDGQIGVSGHSVDDVLQLVRETRVSKIELSRSNLALGSVRIVSIPGVFRPWDDSVLLSQALSAEHLKAEHAVLDMCTGSGVLSIVAAFLGAESVTAVDVSKRALACTRLNSLMHRVRIDVRRGDLFSALREGELFDVIVSNPPWWPYESDTLPQGGQWRAWAAGRDGRALIDRVCAAAPAYLRAGGVFLLVQASFCDVPATADLLTAQGLEVEVVASRTIRLGAAPGQRVWERLREGPWARDDSTYEIVVIRATRP